VWEGGENMYARFARLANGTVAGFSQQPSPVTLGPRARNDWLPDGTPLFMCDERLWYSIDKGYCRTNGSAAETFACYESLIRAVAAEHPPPFFILVYGENCPRCAGGTGSGVLLADIAAEVALRLQEDSAPVAGHAPSAVPSPRFRVVGTQDAAALGRQARLAHHRPCGVIN